MKLDTLIEGYGGGGGGGELQNAKTITLTPVFAELLPCLFFAIKSLSYL